MADIRVESVIHIYPNPHSTEHISMEPDPNGLEMLRIVYRGEGDVKHADFALTPEVARVMFTEGLRMLDAGPLERQVKVSS